MAVLFFKLYRNSNNNKYKAKAKNYNHHLLSGLHHCGMLFYFLKTVSQFISWKTSSPDYHGSCICSHKIKSRNEAFENVV